MKKALFFLCSLIFLLSAATPAAYATYNSSIEGKTHGEILLLVSMDDGTVVFEKNAASRTAPASLTKIMTAIVVLDYYAQNGKSIDEERVTASYDAIHALDGTNSSIVDLKVGDTLTMRQMLECMLIRSGNDAANAVAEHVGGTIAQFVAMMNAKAAELTCKDTHFMTPHGLDTDGQYTTAQDMVKMTTYAMNTYPVFNQIVKTPYYTLPTNGLNDSNTNYMLVPSRTSYYNKAVTGVKTGTTDNAGYCVIATAKNAGYSYMAVVMRSTRQDSDGDGVDENGAFMDANVMINWALENLKTKKVADTTQIVTEIPLKYSSKADHLQLVPEKEVSALVPSTIDSSAVLIEPIADTLPRFVKATVEKGDVICKARILYADEEIATINLVAAESYKLNPLLRVGDFLKDVVSSLAFKIVLAVIVALIAGYIILVIRYNKIKRKRRVRLVKGNSTAETYRPAPPSRKMAAGKRPKRSGKPPKR